MQSLGHEKRNLLPFYGVLVASAACATNPVTGKNQMSLLSEAEELAIGEQQDVEIRREMGVYDDAALQHYVDRDRPGPGARSHRPNLPWTFTVVDSPAINAFALPGGYVYVTRGILAYLDDESELAGVLGHEIGHVTARHAAQAYTRQAQANLGLTILSIFVPGTQPFTQLGATGLSVLFLKHDRDAELEADRLGVEYGPPRVGIRPACPGSSRRSRASMRSAKTACPTGCRRIRPRCARRQGRTGGGQVRVGGGGQEEPRRVS